MFKHLCCLCLSCILVLLVGCSDDKPEAPEVEPSLELEFSSLSFVADGGSKAVSVTSIGRWTAVASESWCTLSQSGGEGEMSLSVTVTPNMDRLARSARITFTLGALSREIVISQLGEEPGILLDGKIEMLSPEAGVFQLKVTANVDYTVTIEKDWITEVKAKSWVEYTHNFSYTQNEGRESRTSVIVFREKGGAAVRSIQISQEGMGENIYTLDSFRELTGCGTYISGAFTLYYQTGRHQFAYNLKRKNMRVQTFDQDSLAAIVLSDIPSKEGEEVTVNYTNIVGTETDKKELAATVVRIDEGKAWLWNEENLTGFIVIIK